MSADGVNTVRATNLAIKGIIALKSMAEISRVLGQGSDAVTYEVDGFMFRIELIVLNRVFHGA